MFFFRIFSYIFLENKVVVFLPKPLIIFLKLISQKGNERINSDRMSFAESMENEARQSSKMYAKNRYLKNSLNVCLNQIFETNSFELASMVLGNQTLFIRGIFVKKNSNIPYQRLLNDIKVLQSENNQLLHKYNQQKQTLMSNL